MACSSNRTTTQPLQQQRRKGIRRRRCCNSHTVLLRLQLTCLSILYLFQCVLFYVLDQSSHVVVFQEEEEQQQRRSSTDYNNIDDVDNFETNNNNSSKKNDVVVVAATNRRIAAATNTNTTAADDDDDEAGGKGNTTSHIINNGNTISNKQQQQFIIIGAGHGMTAGTHLLQYTTCSLGIPSAHWKWGCLPPKSNQLFIGSDAIKTRFEIHERLRSTFNDMRRCIYTYEKEKEEKRRQKNGNGCGNALEWKMNVLNLMDQLIIIEQRDEVVVHNNIEAFHGTPYPSLLPGFISTICRHNNIKPIIVLNEIIDPYEYVKSRSNKDRKGLRDVICIDSPPKIQQQPLPVSAGGDRKDAAGDDSLKQNSCSSFIGLGGRLDILGCITYAVEKEKSNKSNSTVVAEETSSWSSSSSLDLVDLFESYETLLMKKKSSLPNNNTNIIGIGIQIIANEMKHYQDTIRGYAEFTFSSMFTTTKLDNGGGSNKSNNITSQEDLAKLIQQHIPALSLHRQNTAADDDNNTDDDHNKSEVRGDTRGPQRRPAILCDVERGEVIEFGDIPWHKLNNEAKESAIALGYNQELWNDDSSIRIFSTPYENLIPKQRAAVNYLGLRSYFVPKDDTIILPTFPLLLDNVLLTDIVWLSNESKLVLLAASPKLYRFTNHDKTGFEGLEEIKIVDGLPRKELLSPISLKDGFQLFQDYNGYDDQDMQLRLELKDCEKIFSKSGDSNIDGEMYVVHCDIVEDQKMHQQLREKSGINATNTDESILIRDADLEENKGDLSRVEIVRGEGAAKVLLQNDAPDLSNATPHQLTVFYKSRMLANLQKPTKLNAASSMEFHGRKTQQQQQQQARKRQSNEGLTNKDESHFSVAVIIKGVYQYTRHASEIIDYWFKQGISHVYFGVFPTGGYVYDQYKNDDAFFKKYPGFVSIGGMPIDAPTYKNLLINGWKISYMQSALYHSKTFDDMVIVVDIDEIMTANINTTTRSIVDILRRIHDNEINKKYCYHKLAANSATTSIQDDHFLQKKFDEGHKKGEDMLTSKPVWPNRTIIDIWRNRCIGGGKSAYVKSVAVLKNCNFIGFHVHGGCNNGTIVGKVPSTLATILHFTDIWKFRHSLSEHENDGIRYDETKGIGYKKPHDDSDDGDEALEWKKHGPLVCNKTNEYAMFMESGMSFH